MKKELTAGLMLLLLLALTLTNVRAIQGMTTELLDLVEESENQAQSRNWDAAAAKAKEAEEKWRSADGYTHIVLRHSEIDSTTDAFYELLKALYSREEGNSRGAYMALKAHLTSIAGMERVTLGSIL